MKVLLINGSPHRHGCTDAALQEVSPARRRHEIDTEICWIGAAPVAGCIACGHCAQTGRCVVDDGVSQVLARLDEYDGLIVGSPVYFAGPSSQICSFWTGSSTAASGGWQATRQRAWYPAAGAAPARLLTG